jgi:pimeloyl-ACP methyl ester carboxylesterase
MERPDPFVARYDTPVAGGTLHVARCGPPASEAAGVVVAVHGVTASLMTWLSVARQLPADICFLAPDLRGRGRSAGLPEPYGMSTHVADLIAVLDDAGADTAVFVGHSMGAYVIAQLASEHPDRVAGLVLLDAGLPLPAPADPDRMLDNAVANTIMRLSITFPSAEHYVDGWRSHPAFQDAWNDDIEAYARYDLVENGNSARCVASPAAVRADSREMVINEISRRALDRVQAPIQVLRAERGLFDDADDALIGVDTLHAWATEHPSAIVECIPDVNHYTLVMGDGPGPKRVVAAIERALSLPAPS